MQRLKLSAGGAIIVGGLIAGVLDLAAVCAFWAAREVPPLAILQSIASARFGAASFEHGMGSALIGLFLHFAVSFVFAAAYVVAASRAPILRARPLSFGCAYGLLAYAVMTFLVVPLSNATFDGPWPPPLVNLAASLAIHAFLFGLPIALAASRVAYEDYEEGRGLSGAFAFGVLGGICWGALSAGVLEIGAVLGFWAVQGVEPAIVLRSIASAVLGPSAFEGGAAAALLGLLLHFLVSLVFAVGFVIASAAARVMRFHPVVFGLVYGLIVHWIMSEIVVPASLADFGSGREAPETYALTLVIHMFLFGLPIALAASRIRSAARAGRPALADAAQGG